MPVRALILALGLLAALGAAGTAAAARAEAPCWKQLTLDWAADGTINKTYPASCYHQAIAHLPDDLRIYSNAREDILRALQTATTPKPISETRPATTATTPASTTPASTTPASTTPASTTPASTATTPSATTTEAPATTASTTATPWTAPATTASTTPETVAAAASDGGGSVPLPLIVLGGVALALVAAGAIGMLLRRRNGPPAGP
jgi:cobalamin biosynthesis Mg chelatase CobN